MNGIIRLLYLSDKPFDGEIVQATLLQDNLECQLFQVTTKAAFQAALLHQNIDIILSEECSQGFDSLSALAIAQDRCPETPFIVISTTLDEEMIVNALQRGATDYIPQHRLRRLAPTIRRALREATERSARRLAETSLRAAERRFSQAFNTIPVALLIIKLQDGYTLAVNDHFLTITGYGRDELIGRPIHHLGIWPNTAVHALEVGGGQNVGPTYSYEVGCRTKYGGIRKLLVSTEAIEFDGRPCLLIAGNDITEHKREEASSQGLERFAGAFQSNPRAMFITRLKDGRYVDVNDAWLDLSGYAREELIGHASVELKMWAKPAERASFIQGLRNQGRVRDFEYVIRRKSGELTVGVISAELIVLHGEPCALLIDQEVAERKQLEDQLRQAHTIVNLCFFQD